MRLAVSRRRAYTNISDAIAMEILSDPTPDMLAMPRFDDGAIDMQELLRRLAEQVVNAVMDAEADQLCGGGIRAGEPNKY